MRRREKTPRPSISAPIGPVKNSRGADFVRSERLMMVESLRDCETSTLLEEQAPSPSTQTSRKISAGFSNTGPLSSPSTVASSEIMATPTIQYPSRIHSQIPSPKKRRKSFLSATTIPRPFRSGPSAKFGFSSGKSGAFTLDENVPLTSLDDMGASLQQKPQAISKLPKSRTMNALHDLKSSISKPSLGIRAINTAGLTSSSRKTSSSSTYSPLLSSSASKPRVPSHASLSSQTRSTVSPEPEPQEGQINCAQPSAYWSGRFVALHDRYSAEILSAGPSHSPEHDDCHLVGREFDPSAGTPYSSLYKRTAHLPHSTTMSALRNVPSTPTVHAVSEDDLRCRRIFAHLNSLCINAEAKRSLYAWQQAYARRYGRSCLLPEGGSMENRGIMAKIFGAGPTHRGERHSLHALRQGTADRAGKRTLSEACSTASTQGKRLTVF